MRYSFNLTSHFEGQYPDSMIASGNLWVYLPKYSTTDFGLPKGFWQNNQGLLHNFAEFVRVLWAP
jgi:hypothetical protein